MLIRKQDSPALYKVASDNSIKNNKIQGKSVNQRVYPEFFIDCYYLYSAVNCLGVSPVICLKRLIKLEELR